MTQITLDDVLMSKLNNLTQPLELCNAAGRVVARVTPIPEPALYEGLEPPLSREERQKRKQEKSKAYTIAEVLAHLEKL